MSDTPRVDALDQDNYHLDGFDEFSCGWVSALENLAKTLERELATMKAQRDRAVELAFMTVAQDGYLSQIEQAELQAMRGDTK